ncbi:MAG: bifunctional nuclease family protein [Deltaproteobacteria bacterium]|nr:bifunctional nuclease family protein [Deltaproteobacteria bacterium]
MPRRMLIWIVLLPALAGMAGAKRPARDADKPAPAKADRAETTAAPSGFVEMFVAGVMPSMDGHTVFLHDATKKYFIPIGIGESEAHSIHLRHERRRFERPLTHDLIDGLLRELGGRLLKVHVDDLRGNVFVGTIFVQTGDRIFTMDARPSDAIALALGNQVPIYVSQRVIDKTAISTAEEPDAPAGTDVPHQPQSVPFPNDPKRNPVSL